MSGVVLPIMQKETHGTGQNAQLILFLPSTRLLQLQKLIHIKRPGLAESNNRIRGVRRHSSSQYKALLAGGVMRRGVVFLRQYETWIGCIYAVWKSLLWGSTTVMTEQLTEQ